jgi:hypothetical protein
MGARASPNSLLANRNAPAAVDPFFKDPGNESTMVHRRWLLSDAAHRIGIGTTSRYACLVVDGREWDAASLPSESPEHSPRWVSWPPPGMVPLGIFRAHALDSTGWTVQSTFIDFRDARVRVLRDKQEIAVTTRALEPAMGSLSALSFVPEGWVTTAGETYHVYVDTPLESLGYDVRPVECTKPN